jgi:hypothetical protein
MWFGVIRKPRMWKQEVNDCKAVTGESDLLGAVTPEGARSEAGSIRRRLAPGAHRSEESRRSEEWPAAGLLVYGRSTKIAEPTTAGATRRRWPSQPGCDAEGLGW